MRSLARASSTDVLARISRASSTSSSTARLLDSILERASRAIPRDDVDGEPSTTSARTFAVGLSGGVDSAIAAWALKRTGARVVGTLARNWDEANEDDGDEPRTSFDFHMENF